MFLKGIKYSQTTMELNINIVQIPKYLKIKQKFLYNTIVKEKVSRKMFKYFQLDENEIEQVKI